MEELRAQVKLYRTKTAKGSELNSKLLGIMSQVSSTQPCPLSSSSSQRPPNVPLPLSAGPFAVAVSSQCLSLASVALAVPFT
jgi:hypothetical protein